MRLADRLLGRSQDVARYLGDDGQTVLSTSFGMPDNEKILPGYGNQVAAYQGSGVVFAVIQARISLFSEAEFKFQRLKDGSLYGNQDLKVLEEPWPNGSTGELLARMEQDVSLAGNAYIRDAGDYLERLRPDWVGIMSEVVRDPVTDTEVRRVVGYTYDPVGDTEREPAFYPVEEVAHWSPIPDPCANFRGMSWLSVVLREVDGDVRMTDYKRAYLENAATPNLLIKYATKISPESKTRLQDHLRTRFGGTQNAFRTMILDEGADATVIGSNFDKMAFAAVQAAGETRIASAGNTPSIVVGLKEGLDAATYSNYGMAMRRFADLFARPNWRSACAALSKLVNVPSDARLWFDAANIAALQEGEKERADTIAVLAEAASSFIAAGFTPDSIVSALSSSDVTQLKHSGLVSIQLQEPGAQPPDAPPKAPTQPQGGDV